MILYLYRKWRQAVTLASAVAMLSPMLAGQWGVPQRERKTPRAVGVLESDADGERRLIPVTFFYERHYYDAGLYRATPVPFTLQAETVYEVQQFGKPLGTFTVQNVTQTATAWFGNGHFKLMPDPAALARKKAAAPVAVVDPARPVLHRREGSEGDHPAAGAAAAKGGATEAENDPDRPKLHRADGSGGDGAAASPAPPAAGATVAAAKQGESPVAASSASSSESQGEPDHPILRRGRPAQQQSGRDLPESNSGSHSGSGTVGTMGQGPVVRQVAVSDAGPSEPQELIFACSPQQRSQMLEEARELAQAELRRMAPMRSLALPEAAGPAKTEAAKTGAGKTGAKTSAVSKAKPDKAAASAAAASLGTPVALTLEDEQFVPYDLDYSDYATVVFSARYRPGAVGDGYAATAAAPATSAAPATGAWVVTLIARQDGDKLVKLYSAVSDPKELGLYPELRLVDAVDPDGYGRYALLFREQKRDGVSWLLGRVTGYELQTLFETAER